MARSTQYVTGRHRNFSLAERHLAQLIRENLKADVEIHGRLNRQGDDSPRGHTYIFTISEKKKTLNTLEEFYEAFEEADFFEEENYENRASYHAE